MVKSVLALNCDERSGLAVIRSLGRCDIKVDVCWSTNPYAIRSRYVRNVLNLAGPTEEPETWLEPLKSVIARYKYDLVLPCADPSVIAIQRHKDEIGKFAQVYALSDRAFYSTFDKYQTALLAERCHVHRPRWTLIRSTEEITSLIGDFQIPLILKPISSFDLQIAGARRNVKTIRDRVELVPALMSMLRDGPVLIEILLSRKRRRSRTASQGRRRACRFSARAGARVFGDRPLPTICAFRSAAP